MIYDFSYIKKATIITNSNYTRNAIKKVWNIDSTVIYPPCPQYSFPLEDKIKKLRKILRLCVLWADLYQKKNMIQLFK